MINIIRDKTYGFTTIFNSSKGEYIRAFDVKEDPFMAEFPHLIDVGVMGHCDHGKSGLCLKAGIKCYQNGLSTMRPNMTLENYKKIIDEGKGRLLEVALGGCGDPDMHENFEELLKYTRENGIVPNFTTSGLGMTSEKASICKKYCGAVAVSMYSRIDAEYYDFAIRKLEDDEPLRTYKSIDDIPAMFLLSGRNHNCQIVDGGYKINGRDYFVDSVNPSFYGTEQPYEVYRVYSEKLLEHNYTLRAIDTLLDAGVKTNIHYVLSNTTIDEALLRIRYNGFPAGINAVVFLLHKPIGLGEEADVLRYDDPRVKEFFTLVDSINLPYKVGFDSCSIPGVLNFCHNIDSRSVDTCEGGRFSMYIDAQMIALPCSFDNQDKKYAVQLGNNVSIKDAWDSPQFEAFRNSLRNSCLGCKDRALCMGGCPLCRSIVLCNRENKNQEGVKEWNL